MSTTEVYGLILQEGHPTRVASYPGMPTDLLERAEQSADFWLLMTKFVLELDCVAGYRAAGRAPWLWYANNVGCLPGETAITSIDEAEIPDYDPRCIVKFIVYDPHDLAHQVLLSEGFEDIGDGWRLNLDAEATPR